MDAYRTPDERFAGLLGWPYEPRYVEQDGLRMHYVDEGGGEPVLLLHGEPTWGFLYRKVVPALAAAHRSSCPTTSASAARTSRSIPAGTRTTRTIAPSSGSSATSSTCPG